MASRTSATPWFCLAICFLLCYESALGTPKNLVVDTDIDYDDVFALLYILKQNRSEINLKAVVVNANSWANAAAAVNLVYDLLYMLGREDILVGVGGEGGLKPDGTIEADVGGYLPLVDQGETTAGLCRYRQAIPAGGGGHLDIDTDYGLARELLPQVLLASLSSGTNTLLTLGAHTNIAVLFETHPEVKSHIDHVYVMGGGVRSSNPAGCCSADDTTCIPSSKCGTVGNLFDAVNTNPYSEFNMFMDPFAAYQVFHSGLPLTLVALDATNTIPLSETFFSVLGNSTNQRTYEAEYVFQTLKIQRDTWFDDTFFTSLFVWDSFSSAVTVSGMRNNHDYTKNEYVEIVPKKVTVVTSNIPYSADDGSNPFFAKGRTPPFSLKQGGIHSGHVQTGIEDPFCLAPEPNGVGVCQDGYTKETIGSDVVSIFLGIRAKSNQDLTSPLDRQFYPDFIRVLNDPHQTAAFNFPTEFKHYKEVLLSANLQGTKLGKTVVFDMDMSVGDLVTLFYLLKTPREILNLQAITTAGNGWASSSSINIVYDILHMMGRDDIPVGRGAFFALNQSYPQTFGASGDCKYRQAIPRGRGGSLDHDTLYGLSRDLPRSPRRYTAHNSVRFGASRDTEFPERRQPSADEVLSQVFRDSPKVTFITGGPLTNVASFLQSNASYKLQIQDLYVNGGSLYRKSGKLGNIFSVPENPLAEFNFFLDPIAAQYVIELSKVGQISLVPLDSSSKVPLRAKFVRKLKQVATTPEARLVSKLLARMYEQRQQGDANKFQSRNVLGEVLGAAALAKPSLVTSWKKERVTVAATGDISLDGWTQPSPSHSSKLPLRFVRELDSKRFEDDVLAMLNHPKQTAVLGSFEEQIKGWS